MYNILNPSTSLMLLHHLYIKSNSSLGLKQLCLGQQFEVRATDLSAVVIKWSGSYVCGLNQTPLTHIKQDFWKKMRIPSNNFFIYL